MEILSAADHDVRSLQHIPVKDSWSATFHRDGHRHVAIGTKNGNVMIWDTRNKCITKTFPSPLQQCNVNFVSYNSKNTSLAATMQNGDTVIYGLASNVPILTVKVPYSRSISAMKFHHDARSILGLATDEGHILLQDTLTNKEKVFFENIHNSPVSDIAYSLINRDVMLSCGLDKNTCIYDVRLQSVVSTVRTQHILTSLAINLENQIALGTKSGQILVYDLRDVTIPFKVLKGHEQEVSKVSFQPQRKRLQGVDISLQEDAETYMSPVKGSSPVRSRNSDMFYVTDTPPTNSYSSPVDSRPEDSFLAMMGLDKSNGNADENKLSEARRSDRIDIRFHQSDVERNISKTSTPQNRKTGETSVLSPLAINGIPDDGRLSNSDNQKETGSSQNCISSIDSKVAEELKDFIKLTVTDVADDSRNYFLHVMMALTKQKLYLEKNLSNMNDKMEVILQNQLTLTEENRRLAIEIDQLKSKHTIY